MSSNNTPQDHAWDPSTSGSSSHTISVQGVGVSPTSPDSATVFIPLETHADTAAGAFQSVSSVAQQVIPAVREAAPNARISTASIGVNPDVQWLENRSVVVGYLASVTVTATDVPLDAVAAVLSAAISAGGDTARIGGVEYYTASVGDAIITAREMAFAEALAKATQLAALAQRKLGAVVSIKEGVEDSAPVPLAREFKSAAVQSADMPVMGGEISHTVSLRVEFALV